MTVHLYRFQSLLLKEMMQVERDVAHTAVVFISNDLLPPKLEPPFSDLTCVHTSEQTAAEATVIRFYVFTSDDCCNFILEGELMLFYLSGNLN